MKCSIERHKPTKRTTVKRRQPLHQVAAEMLALTEMNWNNTQSDNGMPIAIAAAKQVREVLKYVPEGQEIAPRYSHYMYGDAADG